MALTKLSAGNDEHWLLNDVPKQRGQFDISAKIGQEVVEIYSLNTLKSLARGKYDEFSPDGITPYASTQALIDDLKTFFFRSVSGGGGGVQSVNGDIGPAVVLDLEDMNDVPTYPTDDLRYKLVVEGGVPRFDNDQTVIFDLTFVKSQNLNSPTILETHSAFGQTSCYSVGGDNVEVELLGLSLMATSAAAAAGTDLDIRFYEFTATGGPRAFNTGTLLYQSNSGEFAAPQAAFNYYGTSILFDTPISITSGADKRLFCDANPFANWSITDIEVKAIVRISLLPTP
jgi:hypothetical protein